MFLDILVKIIRLFKQKREHKPVLPHKPKPIKIVF